MPEDGVDFMSHDSILRYEEILRIVGLSIQKGIRKVRLTGGEPMVRKGFTEFIKRLGRLEGLKEITLTTNGVLLKEFAADIRDSGIHRINISLDSLRRERFFKITGRDLFNQVLDGIQEAERLGLEITLNAGPGWTGSGGPWVTPEQSMQHLVASAIEITGPRRFEGLLPRPQRRPCRCRVP
jgi:cyclic pyranopterin phosphate synthase